ncbi:DUF2849 domain-containing protein [Azospirillum halopraeferens]|uniref:DUF2849 domain-containing protein n=1 Tax=Azospirillum halopraeferens TaxID=34010 RepID=UPI0003F7655E|nr:DUF2849 domain-containing protein [Azospirillum halopraeferens]
MAKEPSRTGLQAITANRLRDGAVVWLSARNAWVDRLEDAGTFEGAAVDAALATAQEAERANLVVGVYAFEVEMRNGAPEPLRYRERVRALGPSVRTDVGKQADPRDRAA